MKEIIIDFLLRQYKSIVIAILIIVLLNYTVEKIRREPNGNNYTVNDCFNELRNRNYNEAIDIANKVKKQNEFLAILCLSEGFEKLGYYHTAYSYLVKAYPFIRSQEDMYNYYLRMFSIYANHNDIKLAMNTLQKIYEVATDENIKRNLESIVKTKNITDKEIINEAYSLFFENKRQWQVNELAFLNKFKNKITELTQQTNFLDKIKKIAGEWYDNVSNKFKQK